MTPGNPMAQAVASPPTVNAIPPQRDIPVLGHICFNLSRFAASGLWVYYVGLAGIVLFHYTHIAPEWAGFLVGYLPSSIMATVIHGRSE